MILPSLRTILLCFDVFFLVAADEQRLSEENQGVANMMKMSHTGKWMNWVFERISALKHTTEDQMSNKIKFRNIENEQDQMIAEDEEEKVFSVREFMILCKEMEKLRAEVKKLKADIKCFWVEGNNDLKQKYEETN